MKDYSRNSAECHRNILFQNFLFYTNNGFSGDKCRCYDICEKPVCVQIVSMIIATIIVTLKWISCALSKKLSLYAAATSGWHLMLLKNVLFCSEFLVICLDLVRVIVKVVVNYQLRCTLSCFLMHTSWWHSLLLVRWCHCQNIWVQKDHG